MNSTRTSAMLGRLGLQFLLCAGLAAFGCNIALAQANQPGPGTVAPKPATDDAKTDASENLPEVQEALERFQRGDFAGALEKLQEARAAHRNSRPPS